MDFRSSIEVDQPPEEAAKDAPHIINRNRAPSDNLQGRPSDRQ
jgi:hypothetical protein